MTCSWAAWGSKRREPILYGVAKVADRANTSIGAGFGAVLGWEQRGMAVCVGM